MSPPPPSVKTKSTPYMILPTVCVKALGCLKITNYSYFKVRLEMFNFFSPNYKCNLGNCTLAQDEKVIVYMELRNSAGIYR